MKRSAGRTHHWLSYLPALAALACFAPAARAQNAGWSGGMGSIEYRGYRLQPAVNVRLVDQRRVATPLPRVSVITTGSINLAPKAPIGAGSGYQVRHQSVRTKYKTPKLVAPKEGSTTEQLPAGCDPVQVGEQQYFYDSKTGGWYQRSSEGYRAVKAPVGAIVSWLPTNRKTVYIDKAKHFKAGNVFYKPVSRGGQTAYKVVKS